MKFTDNARIPTGKTDTSRESRDIMQKKGLSNEYRTRVYNFVLSIGNATYDEVMKATGIIQATAATYVSFLRQQGWLYDTGQRRLTRHKRPAIVWAARKKPVLVGTEIKKCTRCKGTGEIEEPIWKEGDPEQ